MVVVGVWEAGEVAVEDKGPSPQCGAIAVGRFFRVVVGDMLASLPLLVTMTIFLFLALVRL